MDLHMHSIFSDGEWTPEQLIRQANQSSVRTMAITDHDEITGYVQGKNLAQELGIQLIAGIELNTDGPDGELHMLGYGFDPDSEQLVRHISWRKQERREWAERMINNLCKLGYDIDIEGCLTHVTGDIIVRTHIAEELKVKGYFRTANEAYASLLVKGAKAYVDREPFSAKQAIELIHDIGGTAYIAHPGIYNTEVDFETLVRYGLDGIEVWHSKHSEDQVISFWREAMRLKLEVSGGSDFHGPNSRNPYAIGSVSIPSSVKKEWEEKGLALRGSE
ncbi:PHP domain-containing protein [Pontibacillus litoralis]|uniref:Polymerase/histidinol phosphatase N-terminal domain-containing protein n=1 Tax=Pontibacillus litoralis JSM 072002 TaxID=1385512 RepID=A0A0A5G6P8_9BACI|nr:PHP domain-containing protein [Pontibacillus litoralis]KGX86775.1 hypothetical protein N784_03850 [Pontibacillus litoralis JSM 072002]